MAETVKVFISSPSDVRAERLIAERVIERLDREFSYHFNVKAVLWEREPLVATHHFQDFQNIPPPRTTDIVVVILWSRLGVPLPPDRFFGAVSGKAPVTGTEWEFEDALAANRESGQPNLLLYRKQAPISASLDDEERLEQARTQKKLVEQFLQHWFHAADGTFAAASNVFTDETGFEEKLEDDLRKMLLRRLESAEGFRSQPATIRWHDGSPFRGLSAFELKHAPVFFGRTRARNELRGILSRQAERGCAFVLVMGASGSGKSSLVKAGLLPDLLLPGMVGTVALCRHAQMRPSETGGDPLSALSHAMMAASALPELATLQYTPERLAAMLRRDHGQVAFAVEQGLALAAQAAQLTKIASAGLVLVVDQLEELFTHEAVTGEERAAFVNALKLLACSGQVWVVATMRSDFFHRLAELPELAELSEGEGRYLLGPPNQTEIAQIIRQPAREAGLTFESNSALGNGLDDVILFAAANDPESLPLLEFLLDQLWQRRQGGMLTVKAYEEIGRLEGALGQRAQEDYQRLAPEVQSALPAVLRALVTAGQGAEGQITARAAPLAGFPPGGPEAALVRHFASDQARLLVIDGGHVRVAHEALLAHWPLARSLIVEARADLQVRARLEQAAARWQEAQAGDRASLLLRDGLPLSEAEDLLQRRRTELDATLVAFIVASAEQASQEKLKELRRARKLLVAASATALVFCGVAMFAAFSWFNAQRNLEAATIAIAGLVEAASDVVMPIAQLSKVQELVNRAQDAINRFSAIAGGRGIVMQRARTMMVLAEIDDARGKLEAMRQEAGEAFALLNPLAEAGDLEARQERARAHRLLGTVLYRAGGKEEARRHFEQALAEVDELLKQPEQSEKLKLLQADVNEMLGELLLNQYNDSALAIEAFTRMYRIRVGLRDAGLSSPRISHDIAWGANKLGDVQVRLGDDAEAYRWFDIARRGIEGLGDSLWDNVLWPHHLVLIENNIGLVETRRQNYGAAISFFETAQQVLGQVIRRDPENSLRRSALGWSFNNCGDAWYRWAIAEKSAEKLARARDLFVSGLNNYLAVVKAAPDNKLFGLGVLNSQADLHMVDATLEEWRQDHAKAGHDFALAADLVAKTYDAHIFQYARSDTIGRAVQLAGQATANLALAGLGQEARPLLNTLHALLHSHREGMPPAVLEALERQIEQSLAVAAGKTPP